MSVITIPKVWQVSKQRNPKTSNMLNKVNDLGISRASYAQAIANAIIRRLAHTQVEEWRSTEDAEVYEVEEEVQE